MREVLNASRVCAAAFSGGWLPGTPAAGAPALLQVVAVQRGGQPREPVHNRAGSL